MTAQLTRPIHVGDSPLEKAARAHVVLLTNFIPPHRVPIYEELARQVGKLTVLLSTPMEPNRPWVANWGELDVRLQWTSTWRANWRHSAHFQDDNYIHIPWDTIWRLRSLAPDVIISGQLGVRSLFSTCYARFSKKARLVIGLGLSEHTELGRSRVRMLLRKWLLRQCDCVIVNGRSGARYLEGLSVDPSRIFRCPWATVPDFYERGSAIRSAEAAHRLLFVGQFVERKGLLPFLAVLQRWALAHPDRRVEFKLVGGGPLKEAIDSLDLPANVRLETRKAVPFKQLPELYQESGILAFPTLADDWGMVVNEALASGVPVLGSRYSQAVEDLCKDGINGWLFRPDVEDEMYRALDLAMNSSCEDLNAMRQAARKSVEDLTPKSAADALFEAVLHAVQSR